MSSLAQQLTSAKYCDLDPDPQFALHPIFEPADRLSSALLNRSSLVKIGCGAMSIKPLCNHNNFALWLT